VDIQFDNIVELARIFFSAPVALMSLIDTDRQWFKAAAGTDIRQTARQYSFCAHTIMQPDEVLVIEDARQDSRFASNPLVVGDPGLRFYAGAPIVTDRGVALGAVCVLDREPRAFDARDRQALMRFAGLAKSLLELHRRDELLSRRNEFHALYEHAPGFIATTEGPEHRFTFANAAYKRLVGRDHLVGLAAAEALPEIVDQGIIELLDRVYCTGEPYVGESVPMNLLDPASGRLASYTISFVYQPVRDANNVITGLFCEGFDVTEQRNAADALAALQEAMIHRSRVNVMGMMATTLAHELNQPLSVITNFTAGLLRLAATDGPAGDRLVQGLHGIQDAAQRAAAIIRNLRDMTRRRGPTRALFDFRTAVDECIRLVRATAEPGIKIVNAIPDDVEMAADRVQIQQVIINLLRNACDAVATTERKDIAISARMDDDGWIVSVVDTGTGVSVEAAESAFSWSISSKEDGMGFGLSICRMILETHGGRIWLDKSGAEGAEFRFFLPFGAKITQAVRKAGLLIPAATK